MSKKKKHRGSGTHGGGSKKKRRGAGSRGGRGKGGDHKRLEDSERKEGKGFKRPVSGKKEVSTINLRELDLKIDGFLEKDEVEKEGDTVKVNLSELGYDKLLGSGKIGRPLEIEVKKASEKAKEKIKEAGGKVLELS